MIASGVCEVKIVLDTYVSCTNDEQGHKIYVKESEAWCSVSPNCRHAASNISTTSGCGEHWSRDRDGVHMSPAVALSFRDIR